MKNSIKIVAMLLGMLLAGCNSSPGDTDNGAPSCLSSCAYLGASTCESFANSPSIYDADAGFCVVTPYGAFACRDPYIQCGDAGTWTTP